MTAGELKAFNDARPDESVVKAVANARAARDIFGPRPRCSQGNGHRRYDDAKHVGLLAADANGRRADYQRLFSVIEPREFWQALRRLNGSALRTPPTDQVTAGSTAKQLDKAIEALKYIPSTSLSVLDALTDQRDDALKDEAFVKAISAQKSGRGARGPFSVSGRLREFMATIYPRAKGVGIGTFRLARPRAIGTFRLARIIYASDEHWVDPPCDEFLCELDASLLGNTDPVRRLSELLRKTRR